MNSHNICLEASNQILLRDRKIIREMRMRNVFGREAGNLSNLSDSKLTKKLVAAKWVLRVPNLVYVWSDFSFIQYYFWVD